MKARTKAWLISIALAAIGTALIARYTSPWVAVGVFVLMWANNLERDSRRLTESESGE